VAYVNDFKVVLLIWVDAINGIGGYFLGMLGNMQDGELSTVGQMYYQCWDRCIVKTGQVYCQHWDRCIVNSGADVERIISWSCLWIRNFAVMQNQP